MFLKTFIIVLVLCSQAQTQQFEKLLGKQGSSNFLYQSVLYVFDWVKELPKALSSIGNAVDGAINSLTGGGFLYQGLKNIPTFFYNVLSFPLGILGSLFGETFYNAITGTAEYLRQSFSDSIFNFTYLSSNLNDASDFAWKAIGSALNFLGYGLFDLLRGIVVSLHNLLFDGLSTGYNNLYQLPLMLSNFFAATFGGLGTALFKIISPVFNTLRDLLTGNFDGVFNNLYDLLVYLPNKIGDLSVGLFNILQNLPNSLYSLVQNLFELLFNKIANLVLDLGTYLRSFFENAFQSLISVFTSIKLILHGFIQDCYVALSRMGERLDDILGALYKLLEPVYALSKTLWGILTGLYDDLPIVLSNLFNNIVNIFKGAALLFSSQFSQGLGMILEGLNISPLFEFLAKLTIQIANAFYDGIGAWLFSIVLMLGRIVYYLITLQFLQLFNDFAQVAEGGVAMVADMFLSILGSLRKLSNGILNYLESNLRYVVSYGDDILAYLSGIINPITNFLGNITQNPLAKALATTLYQPLSTVFVGLNQLVTGITEILGPDPDL